MPLGRICRGMLRACWQSETWEREKSRVRNEEGGGSLGVGYTTKGGEDKQTRRNSRYISKEQGGNKANLWGGREVVRGDGENCAGKGQSERWCRKECEDTCRS